jgi:hypothetical protein
MERIVMSSFAPHTYVKTKEQESAIRRLLFIDALLSWVASLLFTSIFVMTLTWGVPHGSFIEQLGLGDYINPVIAATPVPVIAWLKGVLPEHTGYVTYDALLVAFGMCLFGGVICSQRLSSLKNPAMSPVCWAGRAA